MSVDLAQLAADRYEIADALHRFAFGLDHGDADSLASALTEDCLLDFRPAGRKLGLDFPKLIGRQAIVDALIPLLGPLDTSHTISNLQIEISDDSATLYGYVLAQHFMPRQGPKPGAENALLMNRYDCELAFQTHDHRQRVGARQPGDPQCAGSAPAAEREIETAEIALGSVCLPRR
jgi:SnoaL-like domain